MITHIVFDVDGTLTDGGIYHCNNGVEAKCFHVRDGQIMKHLPTLGYTTIILTGRVSELTAHRAIELDVSHIKQGVSDKAVELNTYIAKHNLSKRQIAYIGDDVNDYTAMNLCAFKACPADAVSEIREICDYVSTKNGGHGAVRDICEHLLRKQDQYNAFLALFGA